MKEQLKGSLTRDASGHPRFLVIALVCGTILGLGLLVWIRAGQLKEAKQEAAVTAEKKVNAVLLQLKPRLIEDVMNLPGTFEAWTTLPLMARVSGSIAEVRVQEGQRVKQGAVLAVIEQADYRIALKAARAAHNLAQAEYERGKSMHRSKVIPIANLDTLRSQLQTTAAEVERAELQLARCLITAPMDCVIKHLDAKIGLFLNVGDPVAELLAMDRLKAVVGIPESDVAAIRQIETVSLMVKALGKKKLQAQRSFLAPSPDSGAYLYRLELAVENPEHQILPGMFFRARVVKKQFPQALAVPLFSVISRNDEQYVFVAQGGRVRKQPVTLGVIQGWLVQVVDGLQPGEKVVVEGHRELEDGDLIKVIRTLTDPKERML